MQSRILRKPELFNKISLSDATIWRLEKAGKFPQRITLGGNSVGWFEREIDAWLATKALERLEGRSSVIPEKVRQNE